MKPGSPKLTAGGRRESPSRLQRGSPGGTFSISVVPPLAIGPGRSTWRPLCRKRCFSYSGRAISTRIGMQIHTFKSTTQPLAVSPGTSTQPPEGRRHEAVAIEILFRLF